MTDKEKLHQILSSLWKNDDSVGKTYYNQALQDVQTAIDLQEEPVSEDLEEAAKNHAVERYRVTRNMVLAEKCKWSFQTGAKWKEKQMMSKAVDATARPDDNEIWCNLASSNLKDGDKVKIIVIKKD